MLRLLTKYSKVLATNTGADLIPREPESEFSRTQHCHPKAGVPPSPCFPIFLARTTFVLESLPEAKNPGQDAFLGDFVFNSSYSRDNSLLD